MAPIHDIQKENSFGVPEKYFDSLSNQIQAKIAEEKLRDQYGSKNPFNVPEGYFQNFSVRKEEQIKGRIITMLKPWLSAAAGIILVFVIWQVVLTALDNDKSSLTSNDSTDQFEQMQYAEIFDFSNIEETNFEDAVSDYIQDYDEETISEITNEETGSETEISEETKIIYDYYIDYSDEYSDYEDLLAEL